MGNRGYQGRGRADAGLLGVSLLGLVAAVGLAMSIPAHAATGMSEAEKLRRMDIMLMVTGLRCRKTSDAFTDDYQRFTTKHVKTLNAAAGELRTQMAKRYGAAGANKQLDKLSVTMANEYGQGHPWLSCHQLKEVTRNLIKETGRPGLAVAATQLLEKEAPARFAYAGD